MIEYNRLPQKYINIYDFEENPVEKCETIKKEWGNCCNYVLHLFTFQTPIFT